MKESAFAAYTVQTSAVAIFEILDFADGFDEHLLIVSRVNCVNRMIFRRKLFITNKERFGKVIIFKPATAFPINGFWYTALVSAVNDFFHSRNDMRVAVLAKLAHDPTATHFMGYGAGCAGTGEGIKDEIPEVSWMLEYFFY